MITRRKKSWMVRTLVLSLGILGLAILVVGVGSFFVDEPLRRNIETNLNEKLMGYTVTLETVDFHPLGFSIDFENLTLRQKANPDPPLLIVPFWNASIQWAGLFKLNIVSDHIIKNAEIKFLYPHAEKEVKDKTDVEEKGWQEAVYALYPVTINTFRIEDSTFSYRDQADHPPLEMTNLQIHLENIQNIRSPKAEYPSNIHLEGSLHQSGVVSITGKANFLADPFPGMSVDYEMKNVQLQPFIPVTALFNVEMHAGMLNSQGHVEYSPWTNRAHISMLEIQNPQINYVNKRALGKAQKAKQISQPQGEGDSQKSEDPFRVVVDSASVKNGEFGYLNQTTNHPYKMYFNHVDGQVTGMGIPSITQKGELKVSGKFMGKGKTLIEGGFRPQVQYPDFDVKVKIEKTDMTALNDAFKAFGGFEVKSGQFSLTSELHTEKGRVQGYIKPFFDQPEIFDLSQDKTDNIFQQMYEGVVGAVAEILENTSRDQVATKTDITGNMDNIKIGTWELIWNLFKNAFVDAMTPAFENLKKVGKDN